MTEKRYLNGRFSSKQMDLPIDTLADLMVLVRIPDATLFLQSQGVVITESLFRKKYASARFYRMRLKRELTRGSYGSHIYSYAELFVLLKKNSHIEIPTDLLHAYA